MGFECLGNGELHIRVGDIVAHGEIRLLNLSLVRYWILSATFDEPFPPRCQFLFVIDFQSVSPCLDFLSSIRKKLSWGLHRFFKTDVI